MVHRQLGLGWFGFTSTSNRAPTTAINMIKRERKQTEQNKKKYESSKQVRSFILSWQIEFPSLVLDIDNGLLCTVCIGHNMFKSQRGHI